MTETELKVTARCANCLVPMSLPLRQFLLQIENAAKLDKDMVILCEECGSKSNHKPQETNDG